MVGVQDKSLQARLNESLGQIAKEQDFARVAGMASELMQFAQTVPEHRAKIETLAREAVGHKISLLYDEIGSRVVSDFEANKISDTNGLNALIDALVFSKPELRSWAQENRVDSRVVRIGYLKAELLHMRSYDAELALCAQAHEHEFREAMKVHGEFDTTNVKLPSGLPINFKWFWENIERNRFAQRWLETHALNLEKLDGLFNYLQKLTKGTPHAELFGEKHYGKMVNYALDAVILTSSDGHEVREMELLKEETVQGIERLEAVALKYAGMTGKTDEVSKRLAELRQLREEKGKKHVCEWQDMLYKTIGEVIDEGKDKDYLKYVAQYSRFSSKYAAELEEDADSFADSIVKLDDAAKNNFGKDIRRQAVYDAFKIWGRDVPEDLKERFEDGK